jgi:hypothetical protein
VTYTLTDCFAGEHADACEGDEDDVVSLTL